MLVNHLLTQLNLVSSALLDCVDTHLVHLEFLFGKLFDTRLLFELLLPVELSHSNLVSVGFHDVGFNASSLLLALELADLLTLKILLSLTLDEFTFKHLLLQRLDVINFEFFELIRDGLRVLHLLVVFALELGTHLGIVLLHLLLLKLFPVIVNMALDCVFASLVFLLGVLLLHNVREQHFAFKGFDHVLRVV